MFLSASISRKWVDFSTASGYPNPASIEDATNAPALVRDLLLVAGQQEVELVVGRDLKIGLNVEVVQPVGIILQSLDIVRVPHVICASRSSEVYLRVLYSSWRW